VSPGRANTEKYVKTEITPNGRRLSAVAEAEACFCVGN